MRNLPAVVFVVLVCSPAVAVEVVLTVEEPIGAERKHEVVSGGIPLPEGKFKDSSAFGLFDGEKAVPVQVSPIVKYPDGSMHWALVSFPVSLAAKSNKTLTLSDDGTRARLARLENAVQVKEDGDVIDVSNGLIAFAVNKANFNGFEWVNVGGKEVFKAAKAGNVASGKGGPAKPISIEFSYKGPVRTTLYVKGTYGDLTTPTFAMAITLCAGEQAIHITHNLRNGGKNAPNNVKVAAPALCLGLVGELKAAESGGAGASGAFGWQSFTGTTDLLVFMRHGGPGNQGLYKVEVEDGELRINLNHAPGDVSLEQGAHKLTEIALVFDKSASAEALSEPLHARAPCAWYSEHDSFGIGRGFGSLDDETETYKAQGLKGAGEAKKMPNEKPAPAMYCGRFDAHGTSECDHLQGLVFGYIRTGQRGFLDQAHAWARYWRTFLNWRSDEFVYGKEGKFNIPKWGAMRCCGGEGCHYYAVGLFNYALITGEPDAIEAAFDTAEMANVAWYGPYSGKKPGQDFSAYGSRGFARCYLAVARAYDVARTKKWRDVLLHYIGMATKTPARDPRGFTIGWSGSGAQAGLNAAKDSPAALELFQQEKVEIVGRMCKHPKYGEYMPKSVGTWPEAMESMANYVAWEALSGSADPIDHVAAEDAMDYGIAQAYFGLKYAFHPIQKTVFYYMIIDFPIPDYVPQWRGGKWDQYQARGPDSWYTKWWPNTLAYGYKLTGDKTLRATSLDILWWGLSRDYINPPTVPQGEAPPYSRVEKNTKGDWMTPTAFAIGIGARPKKDETPPAAITDLKAKPLGGGKIELTWTAPADAGGKVASYQVKHADKPIKDYLDVNYREEFRTVCYWNMAANVAGEPTPQAPGKTEKMTVDLPAGQKTVYLAIRSFDAEHNRSKMSNLVVVEKE